MKESESQRDKRERLEHCLRILNEKKSWLMAESVQKELDRLNGDDYRHHNEQSDL